MAVSRPELVRRTEYRPQWPSEQFMVPLLRRSIETGIGRHAQPVRAGARALDVGCGGQPFRHLLEGIGYAYTGFDVQQNRAASVDVIGAIDGAIPEHLLEKAPFDCILCTEVLEHVARWDVAFTNLARLLCPGGKLFMTCPHFYPPHEEPYDFWRPTTNAVQFYAAAAGLQVIELQRLGDAWDIMGTLLAVTRFRAARRGLLDPMLAALAQVQRRTLIAALRRPWLRRCLRINGPLYLSVFAVCVKQP